MPVGTFASAVHVGIIPTDVPNLFYWIDPSDPLTMDMSGPNVIELRDKSSNAYEFWADPASQGPVLGTINGLNAMVWDGTRRLSSRTNLPGHISRTYCWIMNPDDVATTITIMSIGGVMVLKITDDGQFLHRQWQRRPLLRQLLRAARMDGLVRRRANSKVWKDGLLVWTGDCGTDGASTFRNDIGTDSFGGLPFYGYLDEMAVFSGAISDVNRHRDRDVPVLQVGGRRTRRTPPRHGNGQRGDADDRQPGLDDGSQLLPGRRLHHREVTERHLELDRGFRVRVDSANVHGHRFDDRSHPILSGVGGQRSRDR